MLDNAILAASGVYQILNKENGKVYIGSAARFGKRWREHRHLLNGGKHHSVKLQRAWDKYGATSFEFGVLEIVSDHSQMLLTEQKWIDKLEAVNEGYNLCPVAGSSKGRKYSDEIRKRYGESFRGKTHSPEVRAAISAGNKGKLISDETRAKISQAGMGRKYSDESRRKLSESAKRMWESARANGTAKSGYKLSDETRKRMKEAWVIRKAKAAPTSS
jgi:group I intron endonuclease